MTESQFKTLRTLLALIAVGLFAVAAGGLVDPVSEAQAGDGDWKCFVADRLAKLDDAEDWKGARTASRAMSTIAPKAPEGSVVAFPLGAGNDVYVICSK